jgi:hypothetical protein
VSRTTANITSDHAPLQHFHAQLVGFVPETKMPISTPSRADLTHYANTVERCPKGVPMKATLFIAQNTNNHLLCPARLECKKEPASERESDRSVDQRKNDGVDHASFYCFLRTRAESHRLSKLSDFTAGDRSTTRSSNTKGPSG